MNKTKIKNELDDVKENRIKMSITFFIITLLTSILFLGYLSYMNNVIIKEDIDTYLGTVAESYSYHFDLFIEEHEKDIIILSEMSYLKEMLSKEFISEENLSEDELENLNDDLAKILAINDDFEDFFILNNEDIIIASTNLDLINSTWLWNNFELEEGKNSVVNIHYSEDLKEHVIDITVKVINDETNELIGKVVAVISLEQLALVINERSGLGEYEDIYLISEDGLFITPSRYLKGENKGVLIQEVDTENSNDCFDESVVGHLEGDEPVISFLDYRGEEVFGTHRELESVDWCLLAEAYYDESLSDKLKSLIVPNFIFSFCVIIVLTLIGYLIGGFKHKEEELAIKDEK